MIPVTYEIMLRDYLDKRWAEWFEPLAIRHSADGETLLRGPLRDQAELHGMLNKVRDLNLTLLAVRRLESDF